MVKVGILHSTLPSYMEKTRGDADSKNMEVVLAASDLQTLVASREQPELHALVIDLTLLGDDPLRKIEKLEQRFKPEMSVIIYSFAKWDLLETLRSDHRNLMRAPVSMRALRSSMINLIVRNMMTDSKGQATAAKPGRIPSTAPPARHFDDIQLSSLQEVRSEVDCECPNQVAHLVLNLVNFENYSKECENRNEADAKIHALLARATGHARAIMETAMQELCEFEGIDVDALPDDRRQAG